MSIVLKMKNDANVNSDKDGYIKTLNRVQAVIEFDLKGNIITANDNFLSAMGYSLDEIQGKYHGIFCDKEYVDSQDYNTLWDKLFSGEFVSVNYPKKMDMKLSIV